MLKRARLASAKVFIIVLAGTFMTAFPVFALEKPLKGDGHGSAVISTGTLQGPSSEKPAGVIKSQTMTPQPKLFDIIPLAANLSGRLAQLENDIKDLPDVSTIEKKYSEPESRVEKAAVQLEKIKKSGGYGSARLMDLKRTLMDEKQSLVELGKPLSEDIRRVAGWQAEWEAEKKRWSEWETGMLKDRVPRHIRSAFAKAHDTIDSALSLVMRELEPMLAVQAKGGAVETRIDALASKVQFMITADKRDYLVATSPPMYSREYFSQFREELWQAAMENLAVLSLPDPRFVDQQGWILVLQLIIVFVVVFTLYRNRQALKESGHWQFLAARPFSAGIFTGIIIVFLFPAYQMFPTVLRLVYTVLGAISFILLLGQLLGRTWKKQAAYGVIILFVISGVMDAISFPLPFYRLYTLLVSVMAIYFFSRWSVERVRQNDAVIYGWSLRLGSLLLGVIVIAQLFGKKGIAGYLFESSVRSLAITLALVLFMHMIHGALDWFFYASPVWKIKRPQSEAETLARRVGFIINAIIAVFVLFPFILSAWGFFESVQEARHGLLEADFSIGSQRISAGLVIAALGTLYVSFLLSWILPRVLLDETATGSVLERGVRISIGRLIQYFVIFIGFLLTVAVLGIDLTKLTIILSALGVGIGFGLQGVVNNFVSGLILLFERPVRVGDIIELGGRWAEIKSIGLRATTVKTFDEADLIIPNADLVSNQVTNWTLSNRLARLIIPVGVAYGSDIPLVIETLLACTRNNEMISKANEPQVLFLSFGDSSLDFELRVWVKDVDDRLTASSELHQEIDRRFREANIEIAFPQRDLHVRSIDDAAIVRTKEANR